jgi:hypothetical protein
MPHGFFVPYRLGFRMLHRPLVPGRFCGPSLFGPQRFFEPLRFAPLVFADRFVPVLVAYGSSDRGDTGGAVHGGLLLAARPVPAVAATAAAVLLAFALGRPLLLLGSRVLGSCLLLLGSGVLGSCLLLLLGSGVLGSWLLLRPRLLLPLLIGPALAAVGSLAPGLTVAPLLEAALLLAIALLVARRAAVAPAIAATAPLAAGTLVAPLLITPLLLVALVLLRPLLRGGRSNGCRWRLRRGRRLEDAAEQTGEKPLGGCDDGLDHRLWRRHRSP